MTQIDIDEFLVLSQSRIPADVFRPAVIYDLLDDYSRRKESVVQVTRFHFGTSNHMDPPPWPMGQADAYTARHISDGPGNFWPKVMYKARRWRPVPGGEHATQHTALAVKGWKKVTPIHEEIPERNEAESEWDFINSWPPVFDPIHIVSTCLALLKSRLIIIALQAHFQTRSLTECLTKQRHPKTGGSWRAAAGEDITCNQWHPDHPTYNPFMHTESTTLRDSLYNRATRRILQQGGLFQGREMASATLAAPSI